MSKVHFDLAVVGGGIVGTAHAWMAAKRGWKVLLLERDERPIGATIRNFGMVWPIGQHLHTLDRALRSRNHWLELSQKAAFWAASTGSLHLAYHPDEWAVLEEFFATRQGVGYDTALLNKAQTLEASDAVQEKGLIGSMFSRTEVNVDPRQAIMQIHAFLQEQAGVSILYNQTVHEISWPHLRSGTQTWKADRIVVAGGQDFSTLYPELFAAAPIRRCKLQMMRTPTQPSGWTLGPNLAAGLTLQHYSAFTHCASLAPLKQRFQEEMPLYNEHGIHVMVSQTALGELTIGDSHHYGLTLSPFDRQDVNQLILDYLASFARLPNPQIAEYWHGIYPKLTNGGTEWIVEPEPNVKIVNGLGGAGMTLSFGLAEEVIESWD